MVRWHEATVDDPTAHSLLTEYFANRAATFPLGGNYRTVFPDPAQFVAPRGVFLLVEQDAADGSPAFVGCGGIRAIEPAADGAVRFEVKHLWLQPHTRGRGYGRALLSELERRAREFGAQQLVLDTNESLAAAGALYRSTGFTEVAPYNDNSNATTWFAKDL